MSNTSLKKADVIEIALIRVFSIFIQLVFLKLYTNYTSVYELGIYYFLFTISYSLNSILLIPLDYFQQSKVYALKKDHISLRSFYSINTWALKLSAILFVAGEVVCWFFYPAMCQTLIIIMLLALSSYGVTLLRGIINNLEKRRQATYCLLIEGILKIGFYLMLANIFKPSAILILGALLGASLAALCILYALFRRTQEYQDGTIHHFTPAEVVKFSYPISISAMINWIQMQGYRMILVPLGLVEIVGIYGTVSNVGTSGMNAYATIFNQLFVPNLYKSAGKYVTVFVRNATLSILFVLICGYVLSDYIVAIITNKEFVQYASLVVFGIISEGGNFLIGALTIYLTIRNLTNIIVRASLVGLATFCISFFLLYKFGSITVYTIGIPIIITQLVITVYLMFIVKHAMRNEE